MSSARVNPVSPPWQFANAKIGPFSLGDFALADKWLSTSIAVPQARIGHCQFYNISNCSRVVIVITISQCITPSKAPFGDYSCVGYSEIEIPTGYSMFTPVFKNVDSAKTNTLADIILINPDTGTEFTDATGDQSRGKVKVQKLKSSAKAVVGTAMQYTTAGMSAATPPANLRWGTNGSTVIQSGEGLVVYNNQGKAVKFRMSGEVELIPGYAIPTGYSIWGNNTPVDITLADITIINPATGTEFTDATGDQSRGKIKVQRLKSSAKAVVGTAMQYTTAGMTAATPPANLRWGTNGSQVIKAGEALIVYNNQGKVVNFQLKSPVAK